MNVYIVQICITLNDNEQESIRLSVHCLKRIKILILISHQYILIFNAIPDTTSKNLTQMKIVSADFQCYT